MSRENPKFRKQLLNQPAEWLQVGVEVGGTGLEPNRDFFFFKYIEEGSKTIWVSCYMNGSLVSIMRNLLAYIEEIKDYDFDYPSGSFFL